ncbi:MAG TPA: thiolase family protein [Deltaproteobacteria bacterium]|jgi:acetyl-CoA acetyltransferase|nr:thiolase family protein [Deltaproteobacteria bacterium]HOI07367.1 thiolase family protein [Deltaproteobacteria bacterium]
MRDVVVIGAGLHRYGMFPDRTSIEMGTEAISSALKDAGMAWKDIEAAYCGTVQPGVSGGHAICNSMGCTGLGITLVENASASGSSAFREAYLSVASGENDIVLAFGVDKLGSQLQVAPPVSGQPLKKQENVAPPEPEPSRQGQEQDERVDVKFRKVLPVQYFADLARHYMKEYGVTREQLGQVSVKSHFNASLNPYAHFQKPCTLEQANNARMVVDPLTVLHCCPMDDGAAAVVVCAKEMARKFTDKPCPTVAASVNRSTPPDGDFFVTLTRLASREACDKAGIGPEDLDLIELHDAFTIEEIIYLEALGLCPTGQGGKLVEDGVTAITGKHPVNTSGGLISMGHPVGPTGVGQVAEILWQMRGQCGYRQIPKRVDYALAHMVGAGGVCLIHVFKR